MIPLGLMVAGYLVGFISAALLVANQQDYAANAYLRHVLRRARQRNQARIDRALVKHIAHHFWQSVRGADKAKRMIQGMDVGPITIISTRSEN